MPSIVEAARAKINLTLTVHGRRADGYHELESLVAFASVGDEIRLDPTQPSAVTQSGPFADSIVGDNIVHRAVQLLAEQVVDARLGVLHLEKHLPVAAGIGGGSSDAAAVLRAVRSANPNLSEKIDWHGLAAALGADVPVCLQNEACWMTGVGHALTPVSHPLPPLDAVLVNPRVAVPGDKTAQVFRALAAPDLPSDFVPPKLPNIQDRDVLLTLMADRGNNLTDAACHVVPDLVDVLAALRSAADVHYAALSGAGPTAFAVLSDAGAAEHFADTLRAQHSSWWVQPVVIS